MHAAQTHRDALSLLHLETAMRVPGAGHLQGDAAVTVAAREQRRGHGLIEADAQPLERAGEGHLIDDALPKVARAERLARRRDLHFLGAHDRDHLVLRPARGALGAAHGLAADLDTVGRAAGEEQVRGAEEGRHEARRGPRVQLVRRAHLQEPALTHDADAVRQGKGFLLVVRHEHGRDPELALHLADGAPQLLADLRVERPERLIEQEHLGLVGQRPCHGDALLLATGELRRQPIIHALERHEAQQLRAALAAGAGAHVTHAQRELDVVGHRHVAKQRVVLEYESNSALARGDVGDVAPVQ